MELDLIALDTLKIENEIIDLFCEYCAWGDTPKYEPESGFSPAVWVHELNGGAQVKRDMCYASPIWENRLKRLVEEEADGLQPPSGSD